MYLLGAYLPDNKLVRIALTSFYGISHETAKRLCARLQLHKLATVSSLNEEQITALSAYISSPSSIPARLAERTSAFPGVVASTSTADAKASSTSSSRDSIPASQQVRAADDPLRSLVLESDLRRELLANIGHHRTIGSYVGRRHVAGLPVRGQRTRSNANTARRLNKVDRRGMATWAARTSYANSTAPTSGVMDLVGPLLHLRFPWTR